MSFLVLTLCLWDIEIDSRRENYPASDKAALNTYSMSVKLPDVNGLFLWCLVPRIVRLCSCGAKLFVAAR
jgi:hypothetical protein